MTLPIACNNKTDLLSQVFQKGFGFIIPTKALAADAGAFFQVADYAGTKKPLIGEKSFLKMRLKVATDRLISTFKAYLVF